MIYPSERHFIELCKDSTVVPVRREMIADLETPVSAYLKLARAGSHACILESVEGGERWGRYSFISWGRSATVRCGLSRTVFTPAVGRPVVTETHDPLSVLSAVLTRYRSAGAEGLPPFWGGAVGYLSYDLARSIERLPDAPPDDLGCPVAELMLTERMLIFDHLRHTATAVITPLVEPGSDTRAAYRRAVRELNAVARTLSAPGPVVAVRRVAHRPGRSTLTQPEYEHAVRAAKKYIRSGDIIQAVLSQRFSRPTGAAPLDIYRALRLINPSPYLYFLRMDGTHIIGSSPEILVRKQGRHAETRPIAGTRPRGTDARSEAVLEREMLADPKERSEHVMLVDLGRNDLSRVCLPGSVKTPQLMAVEKYSHVMHMVSSVTGVLRPGMTAIDLLRASFPAGTVSGAPKVRAMQIIDELEPVARGPYAGAAGYFGYSGNMDMAITIRTIIHRGGVAHLQAGAGIVADSVPAREFRETRSKAAALFAALDRAEEGLC